MALIDDVKASLRITDSSTQTVAEAARQDDIQGYINACKSDFKRVGLPAMNDNDARVKTAVKLYVKGMLDFQGKGDRYMELYREFFNQLVLDINFRIGGDK